MRVVFYICVNIVLSMRMRTRMDFSSLCSCVCFMCVSYVCYLVCTMGENIITLCRLCVYVTCLCVMFVVSASGSNHVSSPINLTIELDHFMDK